MKEECLICKAPFVYLTQDEMMEKTVPVCSRSGQNNQCIGKRCPFIGGKK